ncbi:GntR family transcriptional regulator [Gluconobacter sp. GP1]|uniref:GntR family transcriptional regulator n=1 Tax=Gluconobacter sp. GP1 TaxID=3046423 RepID=UPI00293E59F9|nr:GntR family transcriptional regulator [Gluconobacter sp. GP1]
MSQFTMSANLVYQIEYKLFLFHIKNDRSRNIPFSDLLLCLFPQKRRRIKAAMEDRKKSMQPASSNVIENRIIQAVLSEEISPGERLGEKDLGEIFGVSRTLVREAMMRLSSRGIVAVSPRRGWFVIEPTVEEARETIEARRSVEIGLLMTQKNISAEMIKQLEAHVLEQQRAIDENDLGRRSYLLGHFHVHLAAALGNSILANILEELTTRIVLIATLYQSKADAQQSCDNHRRLVSALRKNKVKDAVKIMDAHLTHLDKALSIRKKMKPRSADQLRGKASFVP